MKQTELEMQEPSYTPPAATPVRIDSVPRNEPPKASQPSTSANNTPAAPSAKEIVISKEYQEEWIEYKAKNGKIIQVRKIRLNI